MGRIRTIKPDFPQSESMGRVSRDARLLFVQLWTIADDSGRARASSRMLASLLYPYDDDAPKLIDAWLAELEREVCVRRYQADGQSYLEICNWLNHQKIDRPSPSKYPPFDEASRAIDEASRAFGVGREGKGREGIGRDKPLTQKNPEPENHPTAESGEIPTEDDREIPKAEPREMPPLVNGSVPNCPIDDVIAAYHAGLPTCPRVRVRSSTRDRLISARWRQVFADGKAHTKDEGLTLFRDFFVYCGTSKFLTGKAPSSDRNKPPFLADLAWLMAPDNFAKTVEGRYHR